MHLICLTSLDIWVYRARWKFSVKRTKSSEKVIGFGTKELVIHLNNRITGVGLENYFASFRNEWNIEEQLVQTASIMFELICILIGQYFTFNRNESIDWYLIRKALSLSPLSSCVQRKCPAFSAVAQGNSELFAFNISVRFVIRLR